MTRDEILAEIDRQQQLLDQAVTAIEAGTAAKAAAEQQITDGEARRGAAQTELARLVELLANLPPDPPRWDPEAIVHAYADVWGCRNLVPAAVWEARTGRRKRHGATYANDAPFNSGVWPDPTPEMVAGEARLLVGVAPEIHPDLRAQHDDTPAKLAAWEAACLAEMKAWGDGRRDARIRKAIQGAIAKYGPHIGKVIFRLPWEFDGRWFSHSICPSDAHADAFAAMCGRIIATFTEVAGRPLTFAVNMAGTSQCTITRIRRALAFTVPDGAAVLLTLDDYCATTGDLANLEANLARLAELATTVSWVAGVGFDEVGPHNSTSDSAATLDRVAPVKVQWVARLAAEVRRYCNGEVIHADGRTIGCSHATWFETVRPNGRPYSCVLIGDRAQRDKSIVLAGRQTASYLAANGEQVPSNDPEMAAALLVALAG